MIKAGTSTAVVNKFICYKSNNALKARNYL